MTGMHNYPELHKQIQKLTIIYTFLHIYVLIINHYFTLIKKRVLIQQYSKDNIDIKTK